MSEPDWRSTELDHELHVYMVDPLDHTAVLGELEAYGDAGSVTWASGDGMGVGASIEVPDWSQWVENSWLRIVHKVPSCGYERVLGTFLVWDEGQTGGLEGYGGAPELCSALRGIQYDLTSSLLTVGEGASMREAVDRVLGASPVPHRFGGGFADYRFAEPHVFDAGRSRLDLVRELAAIAGDEVGVGEDGSVVLSKRVPPADRTPAFTLDADESRSLVIEASVAPSGDARAVAGRSVAVWHGGGADGAETVGGYADVGTLHAASPQRRGYVVATLHELDDLPEPRTQEHAQTLARRWLDEDSTATRRWTMRTMWLPLVAGDVVSWRPHGEGFRKCACETVEADLASWLTTLTLREV